MALGGRRGHDRGGHGCRLVLEDGGTCEVNDYWSTARQEPSLDTSYSYCCTTDQCNALTLETANLRHCRTATFRKTGDTGDFTCDADLTQATRREWGYCDSLSGVRTVALTSTTAELPPMVKSISTREPPR